MQRSQVICVMKQTNNSVLLKYFDQVKLSDQLLWTETVLIFALPLKFEFCKADLIFLKVPIQ